MMFRFPQKSSFMRWREPASTIPIASVLSPKRITNSFFAYFFVFTERQVSIASISLSSMPLKSGDFFMTSRYFFILLLLLFLQQIYCIYCSIL